MQNARWINHKLESRLPGDISNLRYADDTILRAESKEELKNLLVKVKEEREKLASSPITSWQIDRVNVKTKHSKKLRSWHLVLSFRGK